MATAYAYSKKGGRDVPMFIACADLLCSGRAKVSFSAKMHLFFLSRHLSFWWWNILSIEKQQIAHWALILCFSDSPNWEFRWRILLLLRILFVQLTAFLSCNDDDGEGGSTYPIPWSSSSPHFCENRFLCFLGKIMKRAVGCWRQWREEWAVLLPLPLPQRSLRKRGGGLTR